MTDQLSQPTPSRERRALALTPVVVLSVAIFVASSMPAVQPPSMGIEWQDKIYHGLAYFVYGLCVQVAVFGWNVRIDNLRACLIVCVVGAAYGISDEIHQSFVPERMAEVADAIADAVGVVLSTTFLGLTRSLLLRLGW